MLNKGEDILRKHVGRDAPLKFTTLFKADTRRWEVAVQFLRDDEPPIFLGTEPLDDFPSDMMIAQCVLVCP
jgi:hypothetical protein